jgi:hypothetical protein
VRAAATVVYQGLHLLVGECSLLPPPSPASKSPSRGDEGDSWWRQWVGGTSEAGWEGVWMYRAAWGSWNHHLG